MAVVMTVVLTVAADGPTGDALAHAAVPLPVPIAPFVPHCWYRCWYWCRYWCYCWQRDSFWAGPLPPADTACNKQVAGAAAGIPRPGLHDVEWRTLTALCTSPREARFPDVSIGLGEGPAARVWAAGERRTPLRRPALNLSNGQFRVQRWAILEQPRPPRLPQTLPQSAPGHGRHSPSVASLIACHGLFWKVAWRPVTDAPSGYYGRVLNIARLGLLQCSGQPLSLKVAQGAKIRLSVALTPWASFANQQFLGDHVSLFDRPREMLLLAANAAFSGIS